MASRLPDMLQNKFSKSKMSRGQSYSFFIIKLIYFTLVEERKALMLGVLLNLMFYMISFSTTQRFFFSRWMVDGVHFNYYGTEFEHMFLDIITDAAGRLGDCVHKRFAKGLRGTHSIQNNLKLGPHRQPITHKI